ncbi:MAG TPA: cytochrome c [Gemmatimonadaceae bacterium]|jgi:mono/diheme cytochrome c family protein
MRTSLSIALLLTVAACHRTAIVTSPGGAAKSATPVAVTPANVALGDSLFHSTSCYRCHGPDAKGTPRGPNLTDQTWIHIDGSYDAIVNLVTTGFTKAEQKDPQYQFTMNPRGGMRLTDDQIKAVAAYVWTLSHK